MPVYLADAATFAYLSAWRKNEVWTLEWRDVDLTAGVIRLRPSTARTSGPGRSC